MIITCQPGEAYEGEHFSHLLPLLTFYGGPEFFHNFPQISHSSCIQSSYGNRNEATIFQSLEIPWV